MKEFVVSQFSESNDDISTTIAAHVEKVARANKMGIDLTFAKFLQETGLPISKIELVQEQTPTGYIFALVADAQKSSDS